MAAITRILKASKLAQGDAEVLACFIACAEGSGDEHFSAEYEILNDEFEAYRRCIFDGVGKAFEFELMMIEKGFIFANTDDFSRPVGSGRKSFILGSLV